jgi:hypothetical protein
MSNAASSIGQFRLTRGEAIALVAMQAYMLRQDLLADEGKAPRIRAGRHKQGVSAKESTWASWCDQAIATITNSATPRPAEWNPRDCLGSGWEDRFTAQLASVPQGKTQRRRLAEAGPVLAQNVGDASRMYLLLIELYAFYPWSAGVKVSWVKKTRMESLNTLALKMPTGTDKAVRDVDKKFKEILHRLQRKNTNWWKVAGVAIAGGAIGWLTMGLAAPAIGAAIGGAMGLSGAAATSAGLALLGGGSLAAGGFGMAGGTMLLAGIGSVVGGTTAAKGGRVAGLTAGQVATETIKLQVLTDLVILQEQSDDVAARLVVESLNERLEEVQKTIASLVERLEALNRDKADLTEENRQLRDELKTQRQELEIAKTTLELAIADVNGQLPDVGTSL